MCEVKKLHIICFNKYNVLNKFDVTDIETVLIYNYIKSQQNYYS